MQKFNKILLVDDDEACNFLSSIIISDLDAANEVEMARDGIIACDLIKKERCPDIIFLDIRMPRMDGFGFLDSLVKSGLCDHVKIVMLTSSVRKEERDKAFSYKWVVDYFEKPLTEEIIQKVANTHFHA
jgi:CheY-like chemotaxis protein